MKGKPSFKPPRLTAEEYDAMIRRQDEAQAQWFNSQKGDLDDGYDCPICKNRGYTMLYRETERGLYQTLEDCECVEIRKRLRRIKASGLEKSIKEQTFDSFIAREPWQESMLAKARKYAEEGVNEGKWFFVGGQVGCGKTHICTAIAGKLIFERPLVYEIWPQISKRIKALSMDAESREAEIGRLQTAEVLYLDDFFKPVTDYDGNKTRPTAADIQAAFEILNHRYINRMPTIISSELCLADLGDLDEATWSRIVERCGEYGLTIGYSSNRNQRQNRGRRNIV